MAKTIMIQGTMSNVGKSILAGGLCRILAQDGCRVAPFKSQNMALNSFITREGLEMGRAQVMQAEAAGIEPQVCMNPILLKPTSDTGSQVVLNGRAQGMLSAAEYYRRKKEYIPHIMEAYGKLDRQYDIIVIEGAGSPAEINLNQDDIVNMGFAEMVDAPVLLVGDIDRGGVFAQIVGTLELLKDRERRRVKGILINKFRGDLAILKPGLAMLEERTGVPVLGVVPWFQLDIDEEDSLSERFHRRTEYTEGVLADVAVIRFPRISNFTDFMSLEGIRELRVRYVDSAEDFGDPDAVILPGSKNTMKDLLWMRQNGLEGKILRHAAAKKLVFGICGGFQMMGEEIIDENGVEQGGHLQGMRLLPLRTIFEMEKTRTRVSGIFGCLEGISEPFSGVPVEGYEMHMGVTEALEPVDAFLTLTVEAGDAAGQQKMDGAVRENCMGSYVHGIFDTSQSAKAFAATILRQKGLDWDTVQIPDRKAYKESQYNQLADIVRKSLDMERVYQMINREGK